MSIDNLIKEFILKTDLVSEDFNLKQDSELNFSFHTKEGGVFLSRNAEVLNSITYLLKRIIEKNFNEETAKSFMLDVNDFHKKRIEQLKTTAHMLAERAKFFKSSVDVDPMSPFERHIIHEYLQDYKDISTESVGEGKNRHIVIKYIPKESNNSNFNI